MTVRWYGRRVKDSLDRGSSRGISEALGQILGASLRLVPLEYGDLQRSGKAVARGDHGYLSFGGSPSQAVIAIVQHERLDFQHKAGRSAKYVEIPFKRNAARVHRIIGGELRDSIR